MYNIWQAKSSVNTIVFNLNGKGQGQMLNKQAIAGRIKVLRGTLSQRAFAEMLNFKQTYVSEIETGKTKPSVEFLIALADQFKTSVDFVLRGGKLVSIHHPEEMVITTLLEKVKEG